MIFADTGVDFAANEEFVHFRCESVDSVVHTSASQTYNTCL